MPNILGSLQGRLVLFTNRFSLKGVLFAGFAAVILLGLTTALLAEWTSYRADRTMDRFMRVDNKISDLSLKSSIAMTNARKHEKDFLLTYREFGFNEARARYISRVLTNLADIRESMKQIRLLTDDPQIVKQTNAVGKAIDQYQVSLLRMVERYGVLGFRDTGLEGVMRGKAHDIGKLLKQDYLLLHDLLEMRRREKDFIMRIRDIDAAEFRKASDRFTADLAGYGERKEDIRQLILEYRSSFEKYVFTIEEIREIRKSFLKSVQAIEPVLDQLYIGSFARVTEALENMKKTEVLVGRIKIVAGLFILILSLAAAVAVSRSISGSVIESKSFAERVASGDLASRLTPRGRNEFTTLSLALNQMAESLQRNKAEHRKAEEEMKKLSFAVEGSSDWILITDRDGKIEYVNHAVEEMSGYDKEELIGQNPRIFKSGKHDEQFYEGLWDTILLGSAFRAIVTNRKKTGELFEIFNTITPLKDEKGDIIHFVSTAKDITQQKLLEDKLQYLANYDSLTELPNKNLFIDRLHQTIARAEYNKRLITILSIDIDKFSFINDTFGSGRGDKILQEFGKRLFSALRDGDTVARTGSDEFGVSLIDISSFEDSVMLAEKIMNSIRQPFRIDGEEIILTASIGISCYPQDGKDAFELLKNANMVMLKVKASGMNNYQFYTDDINKKAAEFVRLERRLFNALKNDEFLLYYQPYFDTDTTGMSGMEALLRWNSPEFGLVSPGEFIPVLEETGLIIDVGRWILKAALGQLKEWQGRGYMTPPVTVNFSAVQFRQKNLGDLLEKTIRDSDIDPKMLAFEMTESAFMQDVEFTKSVLDRIKKVGISINIDDFGTGYSSLSYLKKFPIDNLKIDISFIRGIAGNRDDAEIVSTIISLAHNLNMKTIAEGVETEEQLKILRRLRCDMVQGYYLSRPLPPEEIGKMLKGS
ncbi:MAG: EAL domain-containing protein [Nitrospirae bacterium]|nr:EAL domain-containing protein [Nitrospirota bacterium]